MRPVLAVAVDVGVRELPGVVEVLPYFQFGQGFVLLQVNEIWVIVEFHGIEFQWAESRLDKVESGIGHLRCPLLTRGEGHAGKHNTCSDRTMLVAMGKLCVQEVI